MRSSLSIALVAFSGLVILACGGSGSDGPPKGGGGTGGTGGVSMSCETLDPRPEGCDDLCPSGSDSECTLGTHCLNGTCEAQCTATQGCAEGASCNVRGRCMGSTGGTGGTGNTGGGIGCQSVQVTPSRSIPNVMFLVDRSGSMTADFGGQPRWTAAHDAIVNIVQQLESIVRFGFTSYHSNDQQGSTQQNPIPDPMCPRLEIQVDMQLDNSMNIEASFPRNFPGGDDTPTGDSIDALVSIIQNDTPSADDPTIIVLATDGEPDTCEIPDPQNGQDEAVAAAQAAHAVTPGDPDDFQIQTFVLSVGNDVSDAHLQEMANVGVGVPRSTTGSGAAPFWKANSSDQLAQAFDDIIKGSISCEIVINKPFNPDTLEQACQQGEVTLNGIPLNCPSDWLVKNEAPYNVIELQGGTDQPGSACDTFKSGEVTFEANFPCGTIIVE